MKTIPKKNYLKYSFLIIFFVLIIAALPFFAMVLFFPQDYIGISIQKVSSNDHIWGWDIQHGYYANLTSSQVNSCSIFSTVMTKAKLLNYGEYMAQSLSQQEKNCITSTLPSNPTSLVYAYENEFYVISFPVS